MMLRCCPGFPSGRGPVAFAEVLEPVFDGALLFAVDVVRRCCCDNCWTSGRVGGEISDIPMSDLLGI